MDFYNSGVYGYSSQPQGYGYQNGYYPQSQYGYGQQYLPGQQYGGYEPQYITEPDLEYPRVVEQPSPIKYTSPSVNNLANSDCRVSPSRVKNEVVREPSPAPIVRRDVQRAPTPEPDVIERLIYRREPQQIIERIIEQPKKPPPRVVTKVINEPRGQPIVRTRCVLVDPRPRANEVRETSPSYVSLPNSRTVTDKGVVNLPNSASIREPVQLSVSNANIGLRPSTSNTTIVQ